MVKTITIIDNDDDTQKVILHNFEHDGSEITVDKAKVDFKINKSNGQQFPYLYAIDTEMILKIKCKPDSEGASYRIYEPSINVSKFTNDEIIVELKRRNALEEETVYKISK